MPASLPAAYDSAAPAATRWARPSRVPANARGKDIYTTHHLTCTNNPTVTNYCCRNFAPVRSIYRWRGEIYERTEGRVSLHTRRDRVAEIVAVAKKEHPYEVPGISTRTIADGNPDYLMWISQETAPY